MSWIVRILALIGVAALAGLSGLALRGTPNAAAALKPSRVEQPLLAAEPLPDLAKGAGAAIISRSPFVKGRAPFDRSTAFAPPPNHTVQLVGVSKIDGVARASLLIDGQSVSVRIGDETPVGPVTLIADNAIEFGGSAPQRVEMFK